MIHRPRRLRTDPLLRDMVQETKLSADSLILPLFLTDGTDVKSPISTLENHFQYSVDRVAQAVEVFLTRGVSRFLLFGVPHHKDPCGTQAYDQNGVINRGLRELKGRFGSDIYLITDICMCEYTDHGHCGILTKNVVDNDKTLDYLTKIALSNGENGADMVAPSDMMDGRVGALRRGLDENGFYHLPILSYSVKYASSFYGPFREAAQSAPQFGDRKGYQMDYRNRREALREVDLDLEEGADLVMVKPALSYLDIIRQVRDHVSVPVVAYSVSGEYAMIKAAHKAGLMDETQLMLETTTSIFRAGADILISYYTPELVDYLRNHP